MDRLFSKYIRNRDGRCMNCGGNEFIQCAHYHSRTARSVRFNEFNAIALCASCHRSLEHKKTVEHRDLMVKLFGKAQMDEVEKAYRTAKRGGFTETEKREMCAYWKNALTN